MNIFRLAESFVILILVKSLVCATQSSQQQQLIAAIARDEVGFISNLTESLATEWRNGSGWTLLHLASFYGAQNVSAFLIEASADLTATNSHGETPLHLASLRGHASIIRLITTQAKRYNSEAGQMQEAAKNVTRVAQYLNELSRNFTAGYGISLDETLQKLTLLRQSACKVEKIARRADNETAKLVSMLEAEQSEGKTPLFYALNSSEARSVLIDLGANIFHRDKQGMLPIHQAVIEGNAEAIDFFSLKNNVLKTIGVGDTGKTISHLAAEHDFTDLSIDLFDPRTPDALGQIPACWAAISGSLNFANLMIAKSQPITTGDCVFGESNNRRIGSPLHVAAYYRHKDYINFLLDYGANQTARDSSGGSTLHAMALRDSIDFQAEIDRQIVDVLKNQTFGIAELLDDKGRTPFLVAVESSSPNFARHLYLAHGVQVDSFDNRGYSAVHLTNSYPFLLSLLNIAFYSNPKEYLDVEARTRDSNELTVLLAAVQQKHPKEFLRYLIYYGKTNTQAVSNKRQNAVHIAIQANHTEAIRLFLQLKSFDFSLKDKLGQTPLQLAIKLNTTEIALLIYDHLSTTMRLPLLQTVDDEVKNTPLHLASANGNADLMRMFLNNNASYQTAILNSKNQTALHLAVASNHPAAVKLLLQNMSKASIEIQDNSGRNVLHVAAESCSSAALEIVGALRDIFNDDIVGFLESTDVHQRTPIDISVEHNCPEMFQLLMDCYDKPVERCLVKNKKGMTPIQNALSLGYECLSNFMIRSEICPIEAMLTSSKICEHLFEMVKQDHVDDIKLLRQSLLINCLSSESKSGLFLVHEASANNAVRSLEFILDTMPSMVEKIDGTWRRWTPMHYAVDRDQLIAIKILGSNGANIFASVSDGGIAPIHAVIKKGHLEAVLFFGELHPTMKTSIADSSGNFPIHIAALYSQKQIIEYFLTVGQQINVPDEGDSKRTCLHIAAEGDLELVEWLIRKGANVYAKSSTEDDEELPVHLAAAFGYLSIVKFFIENYPDMKSAKNGKGNFPIHIAALHSQKQIIEYFLAIGQQINVPDDGNLKRTCLHIAVVEEDLELVEWLIHKGADVYAKSSTEDDEVLPVHLAAATSHLDIVKLFIENYPDMKSAKNGKGSFPIHIAALHSQKQIIEYFLAIGQQINEPDDGKLKRTCLHIAAALGNLELVEWMVSKGADVYAKSSTEDEEDLPVHLAAAFGYLSIVKFFIENYPDMKSAKNGKGSFPIHIAALHSQKEIIEYFLTIGQQIN